MDSVPEIATRGVPPGKFCPVYGFQLVNAGTGSDNPGAEQAIGDMKRAENGAVVGMRAKEAGQASTPTKRANKTSTAAHLAMRGR